MKSTLEDILDKGKRFRRIFKVNPNPFIDKILSVHFGRMVLDILYFDSWLVDNYGDFVDNGKSIQDIVLEKYGQEAVDFVRELL
jgi:hypothetical protein